MISLYSPDRLKPRIFHNDQGDLFLQISVGKEQLSKALPPMQTLAEAQNHIEKLVPEMAKELYKRRRNRLKRQRKSDEVV